MTTKIPAELSSTPGIVDNSNATAITIDSSENVAIGASSTSTKVTIQAADSDTVNSSANGHLTFYDDAPFGYYKIRIATTNRDLAFDGYDTDSAWKEILKLDRVDQRINSKGGIMFGSDTAAANTLDDYEEGTWTPAISGGSSAGTTTHTNQDGYYVKVGSLVTATCFVRYTAATGSGYLKLTGLPYAVANLTQNYPTAPVLVDNLNWGGGTYIQALGVPSLSEINFYYLSDDAGSSRQDITNEIAAFRLTLTYRA